MWANTTMLALNVGRSAGKTRGICVQSPPVNTLLRDRIAAVYKKPAKAAEALYSALKGSRALHVQLSSLSTYLTELIDGDRQTWWRNNALVAEKLAELLELEVDDLFTLSAERRTADNEWRFREFPALRPVRPREQTCSIYADGGLLRNESSILHRWVVVPSGGGKSLAAWEQPESDAAGARPEIRRSVRTIHDALGELREGSSVVLDVGEPDPEHDAEALRVLCMRGTRTTVLAAFPLPPGLERRTHGQHGWDVFVPRLRSDWRQRLLAWVANRLPETNEMFVPTEVAQWLTAHDPDGRLVATPSDLLSLCSVAFAHGLARAKGLTPTTKRWLSSIAAHVTPRDEAARRWLRQHGALTFRALVTARFGSNVLPDGGLTRDEWAALVPSEIATAPTFDATRTKLMELASMKGVQARKRAADALVPDLARQPRLHVVSLLKEHGLLRTDANGRLDVLPRWVAEGIRRERITDALRRDAIDVWGSWAATETRTQSVDDALDALDAPTFANLVERVVSAARGQRTLGVVGAIEATFAAVARRTIQAGAQLPDEHLLQRLGLAQIDSLVNPYSGAFEYRLPVTRFGHGDVQAIDRWLFAGWAFSLAVKKPTGFDRPDLAWQLPGWATRLLLADAPSLLPTAARVGASPLIVALETLAHQVVARCADEALPDDFKGARLLVPAAVLAARDRGWQVRPAHLRLVADGWEGAVLAWRIRQQPERARAQTADFLWAASLDVDAQSGKADVATALRALRWRFPPLFHVLTDTVSVSLFEASVAERGFATLPEVVRALPPRLRDSAVRGWARAASGARDLLEVREMLTAAEVIDIELLIELASGSKSGIAADYYEPIWKRAPERACDEAVKAVQEASIHASAWCWSAPPSATGALLDAIEGCSSQPEWAFRWAHRRLRDGGPHAARLFAIISNSSPS